MTAATAGFNSPRRGADAIVQSMSLPVAASTIIYAGTMVAINASGYAVPAAATFGQRVIGRAATTVDNSSGAAAALNVTCERGVFRFTNSATTSALTAANDIGRPCFVVDDNTVARLDAGKRPRAGIVIDVDTNGVWVDTTRTQDDLAAQDIFLVAAADLSVKQYYFVKN